MSWITSVTKLIVFQFHISFNTCLVIVILPIRFWMTILSSTIRFSTILLNPSVYRFLLDFRSNICWIKIIMWMTGKSRMVFKFLNHVYNLLLLWRAETITFIRFITGIVHSLNMRTISNSWFLIRKMNPYFFQIFHNLFFLWSA